MPSASTVVGLLSALLVTGHAVAQLTTPTCGCPASPIVGRVEESGEIVHRLSVPPGEWLVRFQAENVIPRGLAAERGEAEVPTGHLRYQAARAVRLSLKEGASIPISFEAIPRELGEMYSLSVHPVRPRPKWRPVSAQTIELHPRFRFPTVDGPRCAAPIPMVLKAGQRYRLRAQSDDDAVRIFVPAQNGLQQQDRLEWVGRVQAMEFGEADPEDAFVLEFVAARDGLHVFWCFADTADFRTRPQFFVETSDPLQEGVFPEHAVFLRPNPPDRADSIVVWHRPDLWIVPRDPAVLVPIPTRQSATLRFTAQQQDAQFTIRGGDGVEYPVDLKKDEPQDFTVAVMDGEPGVWVEARGQTGVTTLEVRAPRPARAIRSEQEDFRVVQLPIVLRGSVTTGTVVSVTARGGGCAPQIAIRGAGIAAQCMDPTAFSQIATTEGVATRDGEVEILLTPGAADPEAIAAVHIGGIKAEPVGAALSIDVAELQWLSAEGAQLVAAQGRWTDEDERLSSGARVDWYRAPMKAGHVYRILASGDVTPDLVLDAPGIGRSSAAGGIAILRPTADGDATIGLAAVGAEVLGRYAVLIDDLGPERRDATEVAK